MGHGDVNDRFIYGTLCKNYFGNFIYCCSQCTVEFEINTDLEAHTLIHAVKQENEATTSNCSDDCEQTTLRNSVDSVALDISAINNEIISNTELNIDFKFESIQATSLVVEQFQDTNSDFDCHSPSDAATEVTENDISKSIKSIEINLDKSVPKSKKKYIKKNKAKTKPIKLPKPPRQKKPEEAICQICGKITKYRNRQLHMMIHTGERPYECFICHSTFRQYSYLEIHFRRHSGDRPFICATCGLAYFSKSSLTSHARIHGDKPFKCSHCKFSFRFQYKLRQHIDTVHEKKLQYPCNVCGKLFAGASGRSQHLLVHSEKKYQCRFCDKKFTHTSNRRSHEKGVHQIT